MQRKLPKAISQFTDVLEIAMPSHTVSIHSFFVATHASAGTLAASNVLACFLHKGLHDCYC